MPVAQIKALYLFNFAKPQYVNWPTGTFADATSPLVIGVVVSAGSTESAEVARHLETMTKGKTVEGRTLNIQRVRTAAEAKQCHVLFLGDGEKERLLDLATQLAGLPVLTVTDSEDAALKKAAVIGFLRKQERVRLRIDLNLAREAKLTLKATMSTLADELVGGGGTPPPRH